jgi:putative aldouronate transport system substrate-binding protein
MKKKLTMMLAAIMLFSAIIALADTSSETEKLTVAVYDRSNMGSDYGTVIDNRWSNWLAENVKQDLNIDVQFVAIPRSDADTKITTMMSARQAPDIIYTYSSARFYDFAAQGGLADLTDVIAEHGQDLLVNLGKEILSYGIADGRQYAIPAKRGSRSHVSAFIRKDWLDKIGFTITQRNGVDALTTDELYDVLKKFKAEGLCEYPMGMLVETGVEAESMSVVYSAFAEDVSEQDIATKSDILWPGIKEGYKYLNKLYNEGLIQPDWAQFSDETEWKSWIVNGQIGFWTHASWRELSYNESVVTLYQQDPAAEIIGVDICNNEGVSNLNDQYPPSGMLIMVPSYSENVNAAVKYLNWMSDYQNWKTLQYGIEGEHYTVNPDGLIDIIDPEYNAKTMISTADLGIIYNGDPVEAQFKHSLVANIPEATKDCYLKSYEISLVRAYAPYALGRSIEAEGEYQATLNEKLGELRTKTITCPIDEFDELYDTLCEEYLNMGGQAIIDEKLAAYLDINK